MPSPNNPTGNCFRTKDVEEILSRFNGIVVVDEAYAEYSDNPFISRVEEFDNLVVLRTFSKAYAMAALRVGYAVANKKLADMMICVKIPYSLNMVSEGAAIAAVKDQEFVRRSVQMVKEQRPKLDAGLRKLGFETFPSDSNFILARSPIDHKVLVDGLKQRGVLIRDFGAKRRTENCIRTTVGTEEHNALLLEKAEEVISGCR
jgi:histidinol-phosphate aminotransferase